MTTSLLSLVAVPLLGIWLSRGLAGEAARYFGTASADEAQRRCTQLAGAAVRLSIENCEFLSSARIIELGYIASVAFLVVVLVSFWVAARILAHSRAKLSRLFPAAIHACLACVVLTFLAQGGLFLWLTRERVVAGHFDWLLFSLLLGAGLIIASFAILWSWRERLKEVPVPVTGILVDAGRLAELRERIERLAARLRTDPPRRLVVGLEPKVFVTTAAVDLQGTGVLPAAGTLYLPLSGLRLWSDRELDAVIGHELGHFRGEDLVYTQRLMPAIRSFALSLESLDPENRKWVPLFGWAILPAICVIHGMLWLFLCAVSRSDRQRELAADQAAASVSSGEALLGAIAKLSFLDMEWPRFSAALEQFVAQGRTRNNFVQDLVSRMNLFRRAAEPSTLTAALLASAQPHPLDTHPTLSTRAAALKLVAAPIVRRSLTAINDFHVPDRGMRELEEALTKIIAERMREPGSDLEVDGDPSIPVELAWPY